MCCTKYGEDGQSALILDKGKQSKPENRNKNKKGKDIASHTFPMDQSNDEFSYPMESMRLNNESNNSRNQNNMGLSGGNSNNSMNGFP